MPKVPSPGGRNAASKEKSNEITVPSFRPLLAQNPAMATVLLLALPLAWRAGAPPTPCARSASARRGGNPAAAVAAVPQVLVQRFMPMMP